MGFQPVSLVDSSDALEVYENLKARIETLKRRIAELESENEILRSKPMPECRTMAQLFSSRPNSY